MKPELVIDWSLLDWSPEERAKARHIVDTEQHAEIRKRIADKFKYRHAGQNDH
jgi:hypothetical protein